MRCVIKDKATPKTGGLTSQCPPNRRIKFRARNLKIRIPPDRDAITRNEPNSCIPSVPPPPIMRNEPNSPTPTANRQHPKAKKCETNPIPPTQQPIAKTQHPKNAKRTQSTVPPPSRPLSHPPLCETNPIPVRARHAVPLPRETNPIYRTAGISPAFRSRIAQNEPNLNKSK